MSNKQNDNLFDFIVSKLNDEEKKEVDLKLAAGLSFTGVDEEMQLQWMGSDKQWLEYCKLKFDVDNNNQTLPF